MPRIVLAVVLLGLVAPALLPAGSGAGAPAFAVTLVASARSGEPGLTVDKGTTPWTIWVTDPTSGSSTWRSTDGGASFAPGPHTGLVGGDSDVAVDARGRVYVADLEGHTTLKTDLPISVSLDGQRVSYQKFLDPSAPQGSITWDREWVVAEGDGHSVYVARNGGVYAAWVTRDAWQHWSGPFTIATDVDKGGKPVFAPGTNGATVLVPMCERGHVGMGRSLDGGITWATLRGADLRGTCQHFPVLDADDAGTLYVAYAEGTQAPAPGIAPLQDAVYVSASKDGGASWSQRARVSDSSRPAIFPWIVAGAPGKVDVAYYQEDFALSPDLSPPTTTWNVMLASSRDADSAWPTFTTVTSYAGFHKGSICMSGIACVGPQNLGLVGAPGPADRRVLDYFTIGATERGNAVIIHPVDRSFTSGDPNDAAFSDVDLVLDRQVDGPQIR